MKTRQREYCDFNYYYTPVINRQGRGDYLLSYEFPFRVDRDMERVLRLWWVNFSTL